MRILKLGIAALGFAVTLSGCSGSSGALGEIKTDPAAVEALVTKLSSEPFKGSATKAADIASVRDALPKDVSLTWGKLDFEAATGATLLTDVKLTPKGMSDIGLGIAELRLWDFNSDFAKARLTGQRLMEAGSLARRIDAKGIELFGISNILNPTSQNQRNADEMLQRMMESLGQPGLPAEQAAPVDPAAPTKWQQPTPPEWPSTTVPADPAWPPEGPAAAPYYNDYPSPEVDVRFSIGRMILDDIVLRPFEMGVLTSSNRDFLPLMQMAGVARSFGIDTAALLDLKADFSVKEYGFATNFAVGARMAGTRGMRGGDSDCSFVRDITIREDIGAGTPMSFNLQGAIDAYSVEGVRLDKAYSYLAKLQMPPRTDTSLISLGTWKSKNERWSILGKDFYSVDESMVDLSGFHWFVPTKARASATGFTLNVSNLLDIQAQMMGGYGGDPSYDSYLQQSLAELKRVKASLEKNGLGVAKLNYSFDWGWNADSGDLKLGMVVDANQLAKIEARYEGGFPNFKAISDQIPDQLERINPTALGNLFSDKTTVSLVDVTVVDNGGLDKAFQLASELSPSMGYYDPSTPQPATSAQTMKLMVTAFLSQMGDQAARELPQAPQLLAPIISFINYGGQVHYQIKPPKPMKWADINEAMIARQPDVKALFAQLGLTFEHSKK